MEEDLKLLNSKEEPKMILLVLSIADRLTTSFLQMSSWLQIELHFLNEIEKKIRNYQHVLPTD